MPHPEPPSGPDQGVDQSYRAFLDAAPDPVFLLSADTRDPGRILDVNEPGEHLHGYTREELLRLHITDLDTPECAALAPERMRRLLRGERLTFEVRHRRKDGSEFPVEVNARCIELGGRPCVVAYNRDITERVKHVEAVQQSQNRFRAIIESTPVPMALNDRAFNITYINPAFTTVFGYDPAEIPTLASWWPKAYPDPAYEREIAEKWQAELTRSAETRTPFRPMEVRIHCKDGTEKTVLAHATSIANAYESEHLVVLYDITDRKHAEAAMRSAETRWRFALDGAGDGLWDWNVETGEVFYSRRWKSMLGYAENELENNIGTWELLTHPDDLAAARASLINHFRGATDTYMAELRMRRRDGAWQWILDRGRVVEWTAPGRPRRMIGTHTDIDQAKRQEAVQQALVRRLDLAMRASRIGVWEWDIARQRLEWDEAMHVLFGVDKTGPQGALEEFRACLHPDDLPRVDREFQSMLGGTGIPNIEFRIIRRSDGALRIIEGDGHVLLGSDGKPVRLIGMNRDITEQKEADAGRRRLEEQLAQAQKMETLGTLAGGIAHDFNNLLAGMLGHVELAALKARDNPAALDHLAKTRGIGNRARDLVKRLLLFARRAPETSRKATSLGRILDETLPILAATLPASIVLRRHTATGPDEIIGDQAQIQQVVLNLCLNAADAIGQKQGHIDIELRRVEIAANDGLACAPGPALLLSITDDGCGMDPTTRARIFDPFFTTKPAGKGTGLGLAIVHGIVHDHGGAIRLHSTPGAGSHFEIFFPLATPSPSTAAEETTGTTDTKLTGDGHRVLLVDDEEFVRDFVRQILERFGFTVDEAEDGDEGARVFNAAPTSYAFALIDLSMPGRNGFELIADLRRLRPGLPVVLMSGDHYRYDHSSDGPIEHPDYLPLNKPFSIAELKVAVQRALDTAARLAG